MSINAVSQLQQAGPKPSRRILTNSDGTTLVYEDKNNDGKLDLYSISKKAQNLFEPNTRVVTYYDNDGDGLCDERKDVIIPNKNIQEGKTLVESNVVGSDGKELGAFTKRTLYNNIADKPKMDDIVNPKQSKANSSWLF